MPRRVALLVDHHCASSCEELVFEARQSRKVTVLGSENTAGVDDYGNVRSLWLPGWRRMRVPTSRERRERVDPGGVAPARGGPPGRAPAPRVARTLFVGRAPSRSTSPVTGAGY